jgi:hypothetical protein
MYVCYRFQLVSVSFHFRCSFLVYCYIDFLLRYDRFQVSSYRYVSLSYLSLRYAPWSEGGCLSPAKLRSTDSVNRRAVLSRVRPRYRHLL